MKASNTKCLLLNADYSPLSVIDWKKAIIWHIKHIDNPKYGIDIVDFYKDDYISGTNNKKYPIPCVAITKRFFKFNKQTVTFSRKNIFTRDDHTCQYCKQKFLAQELTYDHVVPKSLWNYDYGSPTCWTNIVTACIDCNRRKGNRTPKQANMPLYNLPYKPTKVSKYLPISHSLSKIKDQIPSEWKIYLPESYA